MIQDVLELFDIVQDERAEGQINQGFSRCFQSGMNRHLDYLITQMRLNTLFYYIYFFSGLPPCPAPGRAFAVARVSGSHFSLYLRPPSRAKDL